MTDTTSPYTVNFTLTNRTRVPLLNGLKDVITGVAWRLEVSDDINTEVSFGRSEFDTPDPKTYTDFSKLTTDQVIAWAKEKMDFDNYVAVLKRTLDSHKAVLTRPVVEPATFGPTDSKAAS